MQYQLTVRFVSLLVIALVVLSTAIVTMTFFSIYDSTKDQTDLLLTSLKKSGANTENEWQSLLDTHIPNDNSPNFIRISLEDGQTIYSEEARDLFKDFSEFKQIIFAKHIVWDEELEPYYYQSTAIDGVAISILVELEDSFDIIGQILSFTIILTLIMIVIGGILTYRFSETISRSLNTMNLEIMDLSEHDQQSWLTEPTKPIEVANISASFNHLIAAQRASVEREKQFVADASHELRTPLTAIRGHVNLIKRRGEKHPEIIPKSIEYLDKESKRMEVLVEQLLTLGRHERGTDLVDLSQLVKETIHEFQMVHSQEIVLEIEEVEIIGSQEQLYQIVRNLIENALKYSKQTDKVTVTLTSTDHTAKLVVMDEGIGISDQDKAQIFERFYRADQSRSSIVKGSGIGLSIVQSLVKQYQGSVTVSDNYPSGSVFTVLLSIK
ncbi:sensor histidine kinase [Vagococcus allomyrinae]|nr:HAMP domain-containing sensor histidine kinase [Vagococcus allomyrinae]